MLRKTITHKTEMYGHIKEGIDSIASIVGRTLGPGGLPILIERVGQQLNGEPLGPMITKDGVTVAGECASDDPIVDVVIQAVKDICSKTNRVAGDGTTTAIVLGKALLDACLAVIEKEKLNPQQVRVSLEKASQEVLELLSGQATACLSYDMIEHVATISANGDKEIGSVIRGAFEAVGPEGIITVDEGGGANHSLTVVDGFQIRRGGEGGDRFYNNPEKTKFEAENAHVILFDGKLNSPTQVIPVLQLLWDKNKGKMPPVVFIANEFSNEVLQVFLINRAESGLSVCAVKSPHQTKVTTAILDDMAVYLGGSRMGNGGRNLNNIEFEDIGVASKIVVDKYTTTFFGGAGEEEAVLARIGQLKAQREEAESPYDAAIVSDRISALAEGIAKIGVGGLTDLEVKEKYHRIEDAVNAARAAIAEGVIPGGGVTLLRIANSLSADTVGHIILRRALRAPFTQILLNLGKNTKEIHEMELDMLASDETTWDGRKDMPVKALEAGIIDPVKVTKTALLNAVSIAGLLSTAGGAITIKKG
jgi:chaperonin GroEL